MEMIEDVEASLKESKERPSQLFETEVQTLLHTKTSVCAAVVLVVETSRTN